MRIALAVLVCAIGARVAVASPNAAPPQRRIIVTETHTTILDPVEFEPRTAVLRIHSRATLDAVAASLTGNPSIQLVEVQSHAAGVGDATADLALTDARARAVVRYLTRAGVAPARLTAQGYGDTQPIDRTTPAKNERVAFLIIKRSN